MIYVRSVTLNMISSVYNKLKIIYIYFKSNK